MEEELEVCPGICNLTTLLTTYGNKKILLMNNDCNKNVSNPRWVKSVRYKHIEIKMYNNFYEYIVFLYIGSIQIYKH